MKAPGFWTQVDAPVARLLQPLAYLYGRAAARRMRAAPATRATVPVLCVGNLVTGGQGKTPLVIALVNTLRDLGFRPMVLTRGHGGRLTGPLFVDHERHDADMVGDEPMLLAAHAPTVVARARPVGARLAADAGADAIVMDDGFQNPSLAKDLSIIVVDAGYGLGNGRVFPAGPMRAPLADQLARADALVLVGDGGPGAVIEREAVQVGFPVFRARIEPTRNAPDLKGRRVVAYAGIGMPEKFFATLEAAGAEIVARHAFADHHRFTPTDVQALFRSAAEQRAELVTTQKDMARAPVTLAEASIALPVELRFVDPQAVRDWLGERLSPNPSA